MKVRRKDFILNIANPEVLNSDETEYRRSNSNAERSLRVGYP